MTNDKYAISWLQARPGTDQFRCEKRGCVLLARVETHEQTSDFFPSARTTPRRQLSVATHLRQY